MQNIFEGLEKYGFSKKEILATSVLSGNAEAKRETDTKSSVQKDFDINNYVFQKPFECPICDKKFTSPSLKSGKVKLSSVDYDLRPIYEHIEPIFYDVIMCNHCGYATITQKFSLLSDTVAEKLHTFLKTQFKPIPTVEKIDIHTAIDRYKLALLCAINRRGKDGERAFICLKLTWLYRILGERENELACMAFAYKGFKTAYSTESMPICGLGSNTILFILAAFCKTLGNSEEALKYLSTIIVNRETSSNIRDRALAMRDEIIQKQGGSK